MKRRAKLFFWLLLVFALLQCSDDDHVNESPEDSEKPIIAITNPAPLSMLAGTVSVKATATDNIGITKVQIYLDNIAVPVQEALTATIDFNWNTTTVADGAHTLRFVASDAEGNIGEAIVNVTVRNTLFTFSMPMAYIRDGETFWILLSDEKGGALDYKMIKNGQTYAFDALSGFTDKELTLTVVSVSPSTGGQRISTLLTFHNLPLGEYSFPDPTNYTIPTSIGMAYILLPDAPNADYYSKFTVAYPLGTALAGVSNISEGTGLRIGFSMAHDSSAVMLTRKLDNLVSYLFTKIKPDQYYVHSLEEFIDADSKEVTVPVADKIDVSMTGANNYGEFVLLQNSVLSVSGNAVQVPYPSGLFSTFGSTLRASYSDHSIGYYSRSKEVPNSMKITDASLSFSVSGSAITSDAAGTCDLVAYSTFQASPSQFINWLIYSEGGEKIITLPTLPQELIDKYDLKPFDEFNAPYGYAYDYLEIEGFDGYISKRLKPGPGFVPSEYMYFARNPVSVGGRVAPIDAEGFLPMGERAN